MPKIISNKRHKELTLVEKVHAEQNSRLNNLYWLSEFEWANKLREYIFGFYRGDISNFREIVRNQHMADVGVTREKWNEIIAENFKLKNRIEYLEGLAKKGLKDV